MLVSVPTMQLRVPDGRSLDLFPGGPQDGTPREVADGFGDIIDELLAADR